MSEESRESFLQAVVNLIGKDFERKHNDTSSEQLPTFNYVRSALEFTLIPGGEVSFGLTYEEERAARKLSDPPPFDVIALRPVSRRQVGSFLVSTGPIPIGSVTPILGNECLSEYDRQNGEPAYTRKWARADTVTKAPA